MDGYAYVTVLRLGKSRLDFDYDTVLTTSP